MTLSHKLELIKVGVIAKKLSEEAQKVKDDIVKLSRRFKNLDDDWKVFFQTHMKNAMNKANDVNQSYGQLKQEFDRIANFS